MPTPDAPELTPAYFFPRNSLDNLYKPSKKGEAANDALMESAVKYYPDRRGQAVGVQDNPEFKKLGKLSMQYLVAACNFLDDSNNPAESGAGAAAHDSGRSGRPGQLLPAGAPLQGSSRGSTTRRSGFPAPRRTIRPNDASVYTSLTSCSTTTRHFRQDNRGARTAGGEGRRIPKPGKPCVYYQDEARKDSRLRTTEAELHFSRASRPSTKH